MKKNQFREKVKKNIHPLPFDVTIKFNSFRIDRERIKHLLLLEWK